VLDSAKLGPAVADMDEGMLLPVMPAPTAAADGMIGLASLGGNLSAEQRRVDRSETSVHLDQVLR
jgi:hypothetical protein